MAHAGCTEECKCGRSKNDEERTIILEPTTFTRLLRVLTKAQALAGDEEVSYSDVIDVLLQSREDGELAKEVYDTVV